MIAFGKLLVRSKFQSMFTTDSFITIFGGLNIMHATKNTPRKLKRYRGGCEFPKQNELNNLRVLLIDFF